MMNSRPFQTVNQVTTVPVQFSYSQVSQNMPATYPNFSANINSQPNFIHLPTNTTVYEPQSKTNSQIIYRTQTVPGQHSSSFHHLPNNQSAFNINPQPLNYKTSPVQVTSVRPHFINRNLSQLRRNVSPINSQKNRNPQFFKVNKDTQMEKYDSLRWQNKYQDLKTKYFDLLSIVQKNSQIQDSWLIEEQNKLLKQKVKLLQAKDQKYYSEVSSRIEKLINFHNQTTTQQSSLLIDRFRLESKFLQKI